MSTIFFMLLLLSFTSFVLSTKDDDEKALLKMKKQLGNPDILQSWVKGFNFCDFKIIFNISVTCTESGRVSIINIGLPDITAPFPDALCDLTELEQLDIYHIPGLYGPIPSCITKLFNLRYLSIRETSLSRSVPGFYNHPNITTINLYNNHLNGSIPPLSNLPNLQTLGLSSNYLSGTIPPFSTLPNLHGLHLSSNHLSGTIPPSLSTLLNLYTMYLSLNYLSGTIPPSLSNLKGLNYLDLSSNYLSGTIPSSLSTLPYIQSLDLSSNYLTGTIPPGLVRGMDRYGNPRSPNLRLSNNNLTGEIPKCFGQVHFRTIDVGFNRLNGDASFLFGKQKSTFGIILSYNDFEFDLSPVEFSDKLYRFDISHNKIYGKVPESLATAAWLNYPNLAFNRLCGELPQGGNMSRFNASVFVNNTCLCGDPLPPCSISAPPPAPISEPPF